MPRDATASGVSMLESVGCKFNSWRICREKSMADSARQGGEIFRQTYQY